MARLVVMRMGCWKQRWCKRAGAKRQWVERRRVVKRGPAVIGPGERYCQYDCSGGQGQERTVPSCAPLRGGGHIPRLCFYHPPPSRSRIPAGREAQRFCACRPELPPLPAAPGPARSRCTVHCMPLKFLHPPAQADKRVARQQAVRAHALISKTAPAAQGPQHVPTPLARRTPEESLARTLETWMYACRLAFARRARSHSSGLAHPPLQGAGCGKGIIRRRTRNGMPVLRIVQDRVDARRHRELRRVLAQPAACTGAAGARF